MYIVSRLGQEPIVVESFKAIMPTVGAIKPGRYVIDEISNEPSAKGDIQRHWGMGIRWADGTVEIQTDLSPDSHGRA